MISSITLAIIAAVTGSGDAVPPAVAAATAPPVKEKKICRDEPSSTGSIMPKRTCRTAEEWTALEGANSGVPDQLRQWQQNNRTVSSGR